MKKFEYKIISGNPLPDIEKDEVTLNALGQEGWELVLAELIKTKNDVWEVKKQVYWLKREIV